MELREKCIHAVNQMLDHICYHVDVCFVQFSYVASNELCVHSMTERYSCVPISSVDVNAMLVCMFDAANV